MKRRKFLKAFLAAGIAPSLFPADVISLTIKREKPRGINYPRTQTLWTKKVFDYSLQNMTLTQLLGKGKNSCIQNISACLEGNETFLISLSSDEYYRVYGSISSLT